jgi:hypothetical protein
MNKPKDEAPWGRDLQTIQEHWPFLPQHLRESILEVVQHYRGDKPCFPTPVGATWESVEILLVDRDRVKVTVGSVSRRYTFESLGLADRRRKNHPRAEWRMLKTYAENPQPDAYYKLPKRKNLKISQFRRWLKAFFGIPGDPLRPFRTGLWLPKFRINVDYSA